MQKPIKIFWDSQAKIDLKLIFDFLKIKSGEGAKNVIDAILKHIRNIHFTEQYQVDEILGKPYRKMVVRNFKIIYKVNNETEIRILQILDTRQDSKQLK